MNILEKTVDGSTMEDKPKCTSKFCHVIFIFKTSTWEIAAVARGRHPAVPEG